MCGAYQGLPRASGRRLRVLVVVLVVLSTLSVTAVVRSRGDSSEKRRANQAGPDERALADAFQKAVSSVGELDERQRILVAETRPRPDCPRAGERSPVSDPEAQVELEVVAVRDGCLDFSYEVADLHQVEQRVAAVRRDPQVAAVSPLVLRSVPDASVPDNTADQWALGPNHLNVPSTRDPSFPTGEGITVAIIDSGIDSNDDLRGKVVRQSRAVGKGGDTQHGTSVAGIIAATSGNDYGIDGLAPEVDLLDAPVESAFVPSLSLAPDITWAVNQRADIINMSIGVDIDDRLPVWTRVGPEIVYRYALDNIEFSLAVANAYGVVVVAAAGNCGDKSRLQGACFGKVNRRSYPASSAYVVAVAATTEKKERATYSTQQDYVDVAAPGDNIVSLAPLAGDGTSYAAPHVAGAAALLMSGPASLPGLVPVEIERAERVKRAQRVEDALKHSAAGKPDPAPDKELGWGHLDINAALTSLGWHAEPTPSPDPGTDPAPQPVVPPQTQTPGNQNPGNPNPTRPDATTPNSCSRSGEIRIDPAQYEPRYWDIAGPSYEGNPGIAQRGATHLHAWGRDVGKFEYSFTPPTVQVCSVEVSARLSSDYQWYSAPADGFSDVEVSLGPATAELQRVMPDNGSGQVYTWRFDPSVIDSGYNVPLEFRVRSDAPYRHGLCIYGRAVAAGYQDEPIRIRYTYQ